MTDLDPFTFARTDAMGAVPSLRELHSRWAALHDRRLELDIAIDETEHEAGEPFVTFGKPGPGFKILSNDDEIEAWIADKIRRCRDGREELERQRDALKVQLADRRQAFEIAGARLGLPALQTELSQTEAEIEAVLDEIWGVPVVTLEDAAVLLDVALAQHELEPCIPPNYEVPVALAFTGRLMREMTRALSGFNFASLPTLLPTLKEGAALLAGDEEDAEDEADAAEASAAEASAAEDHPIDDELPAEVSQSLPELRSRYLPLQAEEVKPGQSDEATERLIALQLQIEKAAIAVRATGTADLRAKAEILDWLLRDCDPDDEGGDTTTRLARSLCRDLRRLSDG